jgi:MFS family permease
MFDSYRQIFQNRAFGLFWSGFTLSALGDALSRVALTWFVYEATHSAEALGLLMLCYTGPILVGGLAAGTLLDRFERRSVMLVDNTLRGLAFLSIPLLHALGLLALWHVYVVAAVYGALMMISLAGGPSLVPSLVPRGQLATANALEILSFTLAGVIGPAAAGVLIGWIGPSNVVLVDAVSYFVFALALARVRVRAEPPTAQAEPGQSYSMRHAVRLLFQNPVLLSTTFMFMAFNVGGTGFPSVWLPIVADRMPGGGSELYGALLGTQALGEVLSTALVGSRRLRPPLGTLICMAQALSGASLGLVLAGNVWSVAVGLLLFGAFSAPLTIWAQTLRMQIIPERLRGRTFALLRTLMQGGGPLGGATAGVLLPLMGIPVMIVLSALVVGIPGLVGYRVRGLRTAGIAEIGPVVDAAVLEGEV